MEFQHVYSIQRPTCRHTFPNLPGNFPKMSAKPQKRAYLRTRASLITASNTRMCQYLHHHHIFIPSSPLLGVATTSTIQWKLKYTSLNCCAYEISEVRKFAIPIIKRVRKYTTIVLVSKLAINTVYSEWIGRNGKSSCVKNEAFKMLNDRISKYNTKTNNTFLFTFS